jgi:hypothetical protein
MRKTTIQPSFATLTEAELEQLAGWLRRESYNLVHERVCRPRPEGFGLKISVRPLQTLWDKIQHLDRINARLPDGQKLTLAQYHLVRSHDYSAYADSHTPIDHPKLADIHQAILDTAYHLATTGDNTPAQLLALQRLADFPTRDALRAERAQRQAELHAHKIEMDQLRAQLSLERLELAKRLAAIKEAQLELQRNAASQRAKANYCPPDGNLLPPPEEWHQIGRRIEEQLGLNRKPQNLNPSSTCPEYETA